jgi:hypothetical protein
LLSVCRHAGKKKEVGRVEQSHGRYVKEEKNGDQHRETVRIEERGVELSPE